MKIMIFNRPFFVQLIMLAFFLPASLKAEIELPAVFCDNMVLQQQADVAIWGKAASGKTVKVTTSWNGKSYRTSASGAGEWKLKVNTPVAGGPYSMTISDGKSLRLSNVLIGEVWVCAGQSNMEMPMKGFWSQPVNGSNEAIATSSNDDIRLFTVKRGTSLEAQADFTGKWMECEPVNVAEFSATAYFFGKMIQEALDVPVGLICSSWGGTRIEPWMSESGIREFDFVSLPDKNMEGDISPQTPTVLFNAMIAPMVGYGMRGAIWYQGESNRNEYKEYEELLPGMVEDWRTLWEIGEFPFYYVQIAPYKYWDNRNSAFMRESMLKISKKIPNAGMACTMDVGHKTIIHPSNKKEVGDRLAYLALAKTYGKGGFEYLGPVYKEMIVEGSIARVVFDHATNGLITKGKDLKHFVIAGEDKRFYPAVAAISGPGVSVFSPRVSKPVAVRYAFEDFVEGELFNTAGLPASSFRTDDWDK